MKSFIVITMITALSSAAFSQEFPSGKEFIICYPYENTRGGVPLPVQYAGTTWSESIYFASYKDTATITITCRSFPDYKKIISVPPYSYYRDTIAFTIDSSGEIYNSSFYYDSVSEVVSDMALRISATAPISCYTSGGDGTYVPSAEVVGTKYYVISYKNDSFLLNHENLHVGGSKLIIGAYNDGTEVSIRANSPTENSPNAIPTQLHFSLSNGQCVQVTSSSDSSSYDLTGSVITSNYPIVVYGVDEGTEIPSGWVHDAEVNNASFLEAIPPVTAWGKTFLCQVLPPRTPEGYIASMPEFNDTADYNKFVRAYVFDVIRILASENNTVVTVNDTLFAKLDAGKYIDLDLRGKVLIQTSNPCLVAEYTHSNYNLSRLDTIGSPFMAIIHPLEQRANNYTFFNQFNDDSNSYVDTLIYHYVVIMGDTSIRKNIILDGKSLPDTGFINLPYTVNGEQFSIGTYRMNPGIHRIYSTNSPLKGMTLLVYGYGEIYKGYGYGLGAINKAPESNDGVTEVPASSTYLASFTSSPNPFIGETKLRFVLKRTSYVTIEIYDLLGNKVYGNGIGQSYEAGGYDIVLDGKTLPHGTLYARILTGFGEVKTVKLLHE